MKLLTKEIEAKLPRIATNGSMSKFAVVKFFTPWSNWTWYGTEYNPEERIFFGCVEGFEREWGEFSLDELESIKGPMGLKIERDMYWTPKELAL
jgi:hypothetical protein